MRLIVGVMLMGLLAGSNAPAHGESPDPIGRIVTREIRALLPPDQAGGAAVAVRMRGRTHFFNYGFADRSGARPITSDTLFNLASLGKVFDAILLALAVERGELALDDPVARYVPELADGGDMRRVTLGELATHTSGLLLPQDHPPWPPESQSYTVPEFLRTLAAWRADAQHEPGRQHMYTHAGYILLHLALERRYGVPLDNLIRERIGGPLGLASTTLPTRVVANPRGDLDEPLRSRAVQGYEESGRPIGEPGDVQGYYHWPGAGQMFSSARDMAVLLAANLGELPGHAPLQHAMALAQRGLFAIGPRNDQALAWEVNRNDIPIVEKNGGLDNTSTYIGLVPNRRIGIVILSNRGNQAPNEIGRRILLELAAQRRISARH
jgi:beta-lactamase class C